MQQNQPINTIPIQQFINNVKTADASKAKEVKISIEQAKQLSFTLGIVMSRLNMDLEQLLQKNNNSEVIQISMDGGNNW